MNRPVSIIFSLVVVVAGLGALAHITTGKPLVIERTKTVYDTVKVPTPPALVEAKPKPDVGPTEYTDARDTILYVSCKGQKLHIIHYTGAIEWQWYDDRLVITNTNGGFVIFAGPMSHKYCTISHIRLI